MKKLLHLFVCVLVSACMLTCSSGGDDVEVIPPPDENTDPDPKDPRELVFTISSEDDNVDIDKENGSVNISFDMDGGQAVLGIESNMDWYFEVTGNENAYGEKWCSVSRTSDKLWFNIIAFYEDAIRNCDIELYAGNQLAYTIEVIQEGENPMEAKLSIEYIEIEMPDNGGERSLRVTTNQASWDYDQSTVPSWMTLGKSSDGRSIEVSAGVNETYEAQNAQIRLYAEKDGTVTVERTLKVTQWRPSMVLEFTTTASAQSISLPIYGTIEISVDWGDGSDYENIQKSVINFAGTPQHTYAAAGVYQVRISGDIPSFNYNGTGQTAANRAFCTDIIQWGRTALTTLEGGFYGTAVKSVPNDLYEGLAEIESVSNAFYNCKSLRNIHPDAFKTATKITSFANVFTSSGIEEVPEELFHNQSGVTTFYRCFYSTNLKEIPERLFEKATEATNFESIFEKTQITRIPAGLFKNNSKITNLTKAFSDVGITEVPEGLLNACSELEGAGYLFYNCSNLRTVPGTLFKNCPKITSLEHSFNKSGIQEVPAGFLDSQSAVTNLQSMFYECSNLNKIPRGLFKYTTSTTHVNYMFGKCEKLEEIPGDIFEGFSSVTIMNNLFRECTAIKSIPAGLFDNVVNVQEMSSVFKDCKSLLEVPSDLFKYNTKVTSFQSIFEGCVLLKTIPQGLFDNTTAVTDFQYAFRYCYDLEAIPTGLFKNCSAVTTYQYVFSDCTSIKHVPGDIFNGTSISGSSTTSTNHLFRGCTSLETVEAGLFDAFPNTKQFQYVFNGCTSLNNVPVSLFDKNTQVTNWAYAFTNCESWTTESPYTMVDGNKVHIYQRQGVAGYPTSTPTRTQTFRGSNVSDLSLMEDAWK